MKRKLFPFLLALAIGGSPALTPAGVIIPLKIDDGDNTLDTITASQFYTANPVPWANMAGTPTTLGGYGITDAQPLDADLTSLADVGWNIGSTSLRFPVYNDAINSFEPATVSLFMLGLFDDADASAARSTLGLEIGTDVLAPDGDGSGLTNLPDGAGFGVLTPTPPTDTNLAVDLADNSLIEIDTASATGDITLALSNAVAGKTYKFKVSHGATPRALAFPSNTLSASGSNLATGSEANATDLIYAEYTGSQWALGPRVDGLFSLAPETVAYLTTLEAADGTVLTKADQLILDRIMVGIQARGYWATSRASISSSNYNVSTGNTVYAFGGLSSANFTKTGTVAWAAGGLVMDGATESVTAPDFLPGGTSLTVVYYGNVFGNASNSLIWSHYEASNNQRSAAIRIAQSDPERIEFLLSQNGTTANAQFDFPPSTVDHIADASQVLAMVFDAGDLKAWSDATVIFDATLDDVTSLHNSTANVIAHDATASGTLRFFLVSTSAWSEADLAWLRGELETLDLN